MKKCIIFLAILGVFNSCIWEESYKFNVRNNSNKTLRFYIAYPYDINVYPDTILFNQFSVARLVSHSTYHLGGFEKIDDKIAKIPSDTLSFYFFDSETIETYSWEKICEDYKVLKRYDLSIEDIQLLDYEIPYPPTKQMKNMRMYPPYNGNEY